MLWSIDSCQKGYPQTSVTWQYRELKRTTHWGDVFFKVIHWPVVGFNWSQAQIYNEKTICRLTKCIDRAIARAVHQGLWNFPVMTEQTRLISSISFNLKLKSGVWWKLFDFGLYKACTAYPSRWLWKPRSSVGLALSAFFLKANQGNFTMYMRHKQ